MDRQGSLIASWSNTFAALSACNQRHGWTGYLGQSLATIRDSFINQNHSLEVVYGIPPPHPLTYVSGTAKVQAVEEYLKDRDSLLCDLRRNLRLAQERMTSHANQRRREVSFEVGDYVYLKLQPYRQTTVTFRSSLKLSPRFYGPFQILSKVSLIAYRLDLPKDYQIHDVFHVSLLRKHLGSINHSSIITTSSSHRRFFHYSSTCFHIRQA